MPDIASALKAEISRIARKEVRAEIEALRMSATTHRKDLATLKARAQELEKIVRGLGGSHKAASRITEEPAEDQRFSAKGWPHIESVSDCPRLKSGCYWGSQRGPSTTGSRAGLVRGRVICLRLRR